MLALSFLPLRLLGDTSLCGVNGGPIRIPRTNDPFHSPDKWIHLAPRTHHLLIFLPLVS
jgi:hypothetical protein